ncbi:unnamed protein product [Zymoseptoria tritici ST99CH_1E4]|nr:unnamed protein product [Zymoseptoria tritici ST99CH_1E4]
MPMSPRPPSARLRSACTHCHVGKVKCSGERSGCSRCLQLNLQCHYEYSMVGKCSTVRRRGRAMGAPEGSRPKSAGNPASEHTSPRRSGSAAHVGFEPTADWADGLLSEDLFMDFPQYGNHLPGVDGLVDAVSGNVLDQTFAPFPQPVGQVSAPQTSPGWTTEDFQPSSSANSHIDHATGLVFDKCSGSIATLFQLMETPATGADVLLGTLKTQVGQLATATESRSFGRCKACQMLVVVALQLMSEIYGSVLGMSGCGENIRQQPSPESTTLDTETRPSHPRMKFGSFLIDESTAAVLWRQVVRSELEKALALVRTLNRQLEDCWPDRCQTLQPLLEDLKNRMSAFIGCIP